MEQELSLCQELSLFDGKSSVSLSPPLYLYLSLSVTIIHFKVKVSLRTGEDALKIRQLCFGDLVCVFLDVQATERAAHVKTWKW